MPIHRLIVAFLLPLLLVPLSASAGRVSRLERSTARLAKTRLTSARPLVVIRTKKLSVSLRPERKTIVVNVTGLLSFREEGYTLGADGRLSIEDRAALEALIEKHAPAISANMIDAEVRRGITAFKQREIVLRRQDPLIDDLLERARTTTASATDVDLWRGRRAALSYSPSANVLVGHRGFSAQAFSLSRTAGGLTVDPASLDQLRTFLADGR
jgi:hypothetical protein